MECSICFESILGKMVTTECNHTFCKDCIDGWFDRGENSCPLCRGEIKYIQLDEERVRVLIHRNIPEIIINNGRYYLLLRWVLFQWVSLIILGIVIFIINLENNDLTEENNELIIRNEYLLDSNNKFIDMNNDQVLSFIRVIGKYGGIYRPCNIPSYYIDRC